MTYRRRAANQPHIQAEPGFGEIESFWRFSSVRRVELKRGTPTRPTRPSSLRQLCRRAATLPRTRNRPFPVAPRYRPDVTDDIHAMWRTIGLHWQVMKEQAPEDYEPVVQVHLLGSSEPIPVGRVETHRGQGLVMLHVITEGSTPTRTAVTVSSTSSTTACPTRRSFTGAQGRGPLGSS